MNKTILAFALLAVASASAFAESSAGSSSGSVAQVAPVNVGNPVINMPANSPNTYSEFRTNQAASAPPVYVNSPTADTCERAGFGISGGAVSGSVGVNIPRGMSAECNMRADSVNLKFTQAPQVVIKARQCMDPNMAEAYARAGQECVDARQNKPQPLALLP